MADEGVEQPGLVLVNPRDRTPSPPSSSSQYERGLGESTFSPGGLISEIPANSQVVIDPAYFVIPEEHSSEDKESDRDRGACRSDNNEATQKKSVPPPSKKKGEPKLILDLGLRGQKARRSGRRLEFLAKEYQIKTGASVYLKTSFKNKNGSYQTHVVGEDFRLPEDTKVVDAATLASGLNQTVVQTIGSIFKAQTSVPGHSGLAPFFSPRKIVPEILDKNKCIICKQKDIRQGLLVYKSEWIGCSERECGKWVHADCLGFPGVTESKVKAMPNYYCQEHVMNGRMHAGQCPEFVEGPRMSSTPGVAATPTSSTSTASAEAQETTVSNPAPTKRARRGKRSK